MGIFSKLAQLIFAPVDENGNPRPISPQDAQVWGTEVERVVSLFVSSGGLIYESKAALDADLNRDARTMAWVIGDAIAANNGIYAKVGASGTGSWARRSDLPFSFIIATDAGAGTANAIQATTAIPVSASSLIWMNIFETNGPGAVTVRFNGAGPTYTIKTNSGNDPVTGGLVAGTIVLGIIAGNSFRLVSDQASTAIVAAAEAAADVALASAAVIKSTVAYGNIQAAINDCVGGELSFPPGTYDVTGLVGVDGIKLVPRGDVTLRRPDNSPSSAGILDFTSKTGFSIEGFTFDANKENNIQPANAINLIACSNYRVEENNLRGAKASSGYGAAIAVLAGNNQTAKELGKIIGNVVKDCEGPGIYINKEYYLSIVRNLVTGSRDGIQLANLVYPPVADVFQSLEVSRNRCLENLENGINFIGFYRSFGITGAELGNGVPPARFVLIEGNHCHDNPLYGLIWQGSGGSVIGNFLKRNGSADGTGGGLLLNTEYTVAAGNILHDNANFQIDAGGAYGLQILNNNLRRGGFTLAVPTIDINIGGAQQCVVDNNLIHQEGSHTMVGIKAIGTEGTEATNPFNQLGIGITTSRNKIISNGAAGSVGILVTEGVDRAIVDDNDIQGTPIGRDYFLEVPNLKQRGNTSSEMYSSNGFGKVVASASPLIIPDVGEIFFVTGAVSFDTIRTVSANSYHQKVRNITVTAQGSGYSYATPPTVVFTGGGGSGAAGWAQIDTSGRIIDVVLTNLGSGYTSAPTVTFSGGSGSGAAATAQVGCNNFAGRKISLLFQGTPTVTKGTGNLGLGATRTMNSNAVLELRGYSGGWYETGFSANT